MVLRGEGFVRLQGLQFVVPIVDLMETVLPFPNTPICPLVEVGDVVEH